MKKLQWTKDIVDRKTLLVRLMGIVAFPSNALFRATFAPIPSENEVKSPPKVGIHCNANVMLMGKVVNENYFFLHFYFGP